MTGFRNSAAIATCPRCKQTVLTGHEGGSPYTIELTTLDQVQEVLAYTDHAVTYLLRHANDTANMTVKYRTPRYIGSKPPPGTTVHREHPCKATPTPITPTPTPGKPATRRPPINPITGMPTDGTLPFIPNDGATPPFNHGSSRLPNPPCDKCGLDVTPGTGATLHIPGQQPWGCHMRECCPAAPRDDTTEGDPYVHWSEYDSTHEPERVSASGIRADGCLLPEDLVIRGLPTRRSIARQHYRRTTTIGDIDTIHETLPDRDGGVVIRRGELPEPVAEPVVGDVRATRE